MAYIDTKYIGECETCRHHISGKCDTWCDHGECYRPNMSKIPTADVVEVKHGEWVFNRHQAPNEKTYYCSLCAEGESDYGRDNYCPNCGAKMDRK